MATYKVIQDIEAEDKILGPLTLRQFIFGLITAFLLYMSFLCISKGVTFMLAILLPPALFTGFFAFPFGKDQPTEIWALAKIRFMFKPRKRIWDQSGVKELVTITAPKKIERVLTNGLSEHEVESRLKALANTIDSRGWAIKNVNSYSQAGAVASDRLIDIDSIPREVPGYDIQASDDMMDEVNNPIAQQFDSMIAASEQNHRKKLVDELNGIRADNAAQPQGQPADYWFLNQTQAPTNLPADQAMFASSQVVQPGLDDTSPVSAGQATPDETALVEQLKAKNSAQSVSYAHLRTLKPLGSTPATPQVDQLTPTPAAIPSPATYDPAILSLANNNDLNVATLAREANKSQHDKSADDGEVVISLR